MMSATMVRNHKQVAQETVVRLRGVEEVINEIEVA